jgi:serine protease Do
LTSGVLLGLVLAISGSDPGQVQVQPPLSGSSGPTDIAAAAASVAPAVVQLESESGLGSGVIYDSEGLILTAAHVVDGETKVGVRLADGRLFEGVVVGAHAVTDIAVISIPVDGLPVALLGYGTAAEVGEIAIALGSPFGLNQTVTAGIISATGRNINGVPMVQTDAAINPGNSGGPLINAAGKVIGINDIIFTEGGGNDGIGFAVAIDVAIVVADQIVAGDDVQLASLGVATIPDTSGNGGAIVREILTGSAADDADLRVGDRIVAIDGASILDPGQLFAAVVTHRPGASAEIEFTRAGRLMAVDVTLGGISP